MIAGWCKTLSGAFLQGLEYHNWLEFYENRTFRGLNGLANGFLEGLKGSRAFGDEGRTFPDGVNEGV